MSQTEKLIGLLKAISSKIVEVEPELTELDSAAGDGDCGLGLKTGFGEVLAQADTFSGLTVSDVFKKTGMLLVSKIGGTSGAILGTGFMRLAKALGGVDEVTPADAAQALRAALEGMQQRGENTQVGDKTMIDALYPAVEAFEESVDAGVSVGEAFAKAADAAKAGSDSTIAMIAKKGRASYLGERSRGCRDAGSMAIYYMFLAARDYFAA